MAVFQRLLVINRWEKNLALGQGWPDQSQQGDRENLRNFMVNGKSMVFGYDALIEGRITPAQTGERSVLQFDYMSPRRSHGKTAIPWEVPRRRGLHRIGGTGRQAPPCSSSAQKSFRDDVREAHSRIC